MFVSHVSDYNIQRISQISKVTNSRLTHLILTPSMPKVFHIVNILLSACVMVNVGNKESLDEMDWSCQSNPL